MCEYCAYNQDGYCTAPHVWWKYDNPNGSCNLFIDKDKGKEDTSHEDP